MREKYIVALILAGCFVLYLPVANSSCTIADIESAMRDVAEGNFKDYPESNSPDLSLTHNHPDSQLSQSTGLSLTINDICGKDVTFIFNNFKSKTNAKDISDQIKTGVDKLYYKNRTVDVDKGKNRSLDVSVKDNGKEIFSRSSMKILEGKDAKDFLNALGYVFAEEILSSSSLAGTSASSRVNDIVQSRIINPVMQTRNQKQQKDHKQAKQNMQVFLADVKYEHGEFRQSNDNGDIVGFTGGASLDMDNDVSIGAIIPYDYLDFSNFNAHRSGIILYGKKAWQLNKNLELTTALNTSYMYTISRFGSSTLHGATYGGGFSSRLMYDDGGDFIPAATFSIQYNEDGHDYSGNRQYLVKVGPTLGYRMTDNTLIQVSGIWNKDATSRPTGIDTDFFDVGIEGSWIISDMWQLRGGFKKMLEYQQYDSDVVYLGSSIRF